MDQYFEVGEDVILVSEMCSEKNGEATVLGVVTGWEASCVHCGQELSRDYSDIAYWLSITSLDCCNPWSQKALRKKYRGSGDFEALMEDITGEIKV